jgi:Ca2+-binding EF-hand superfamily protein
MKSVLLLLPASLILAACESTPPNGESNAPESAAQRFARADLNKDGVLSAPEISQMVDTKMFAARDTDKNTVITVNECTAGELADHKAADTNKDGSVTQAEFSAHASKSPERKAGFKQADVNGDGVLNEAEAEAYYASKE